MPGIISELGGLARKIMISNHMTQFEKSFFAYLSETKVQRFYHQIKICVSSFFFDLKPLPTFGKVKSSLRIRKKKMQASTNLKITLK